jgi:2',3'-cyclic-nucleotide 2'-phosphodiesterase
LAEYTLLFLGDVVGEPGRKALEAALSGLKHQHRPLFTVVNGENAASGSGIIPRHADAILGWGADAITLGNHAFHKRDIANYLDSGKPIVRPGNMSRRLPGKGVTILEKEGVRLAVANLCGRVGMEPTYDDPFAAADALMDTIGTPHLFLDFHAEATSEKVAMGWHLAGRATAVIGTHTHVPTADERVLPGGTAYQTDTGMCGPRDGVIGTDRDIVLRRFRGGLSERFEVAGGKSVILGAVVRVQRESGRAVAIERVRIED